MTPTQVKIPPRCHPDYCTLSLIDTPHAQLSSNSGLPVFCPLLKEFNILNDRCLLLEDTAPKPLSAERK